MLPQHVTRFESHLLTWDNHSSPLARGTGALEKHIQRLRSSVSFRLLCIHRTIQPPPHPALLGLLHFILLTDVVPFILSHLFPRKAPVIHSIYETDRK